MKKIFFSLSVAAFLMIASIATVFAQKFLLRIPPHPAKVWLSVPDSPVAPPDPDVTGAYVPAPQLPFASVNWMKKAIPSNTQSTFCFTVAHSGENGV